MSNANGSLRGLLAELRRVLEEERAVLLSGHPEWLAAVVDRKLDLAEAIERAWQAAPATLSRDEIVSLAAYNRGNSVIASALLRQLTQLSDALRGRELHRSYRPDGAEARPPAQNRLGAA
jgi:hypothetical protein